ncbi:MAG TPA: GNAT family N-acetyltransferase [Solirubrobacteraceae bacterium]|nr:GNAT family N-acetyltransferase [Solirubrobacteraceae bacterium]
MTSELQIRPGSIADAPILIALFDAAVAWLVARGQTGQWGSQPFSTRPEGRAKVDELSGGGGLRIAELSGVPVGALVVGDAPAYVPPAEAAELYVQLLLTSRRHAGRGIGGRLVRVAVAEARAASRPLLRVDCWAGAPTLVDWYRRQGFRPTSTFDLNGWVGQVFAMPVA